MWCSVAPSNLLSPLDDQEISVLATNLYAGLDLKVLEIMGAQLLFFEHNLVMEPIY